MVRCNSGHKCAGKLSFMFGFVMSLPEPVNWFGCPGLSMNNSSCYMLELRICR